MCSKKKCRDGVACVVFLQPVLPVHCHPYTQFLWFLALPSLHPSTFLENIFYTCLHTFSCTIVHLKEDVVLASFLLNSTNINDQSSHCYHSGKDTGP